MSAQLSISTEDASATFSPDRVYRYCLWRHWDRSKGRVLWCMLNPSTADESALDPTLRRCKQYSLDWGYGGFEVVNLFAYRATDPKAMRAVADPIGPENFTTIRKMAVPAACVVVGWGRLKPTEREHACGVADMLSVTQYLWCLGTNADGSPKHPLYLRADLKLVRFM